MSLGRRPKNNTNHKLLKALAYPASAYFVLAAAGTAVYAEEAQPQEITESTIVESTEETVILEDPEYMNTEPSEDANEMTIDQTDEQEGVKTQDSSGTCGEQVSWTLTEDGTLTISGTGVMYDYSSVNRSPFYYNETITSVIIEDGVTNIGNDMFDNCSELRSITIAKSVTSIGDKAFTSCVGLTDITLPKEMRIIGEHAFDLCTALKSIRIPEGVTTIGRYAFDNCEGLETVIIPRTVTSLEAGAFYNCISLTEIIIPDTITSIQASLFARCASLTTVKIPENVTSIGNMAFQYCDSLSSITIPEKVTFIGNYAFGSCPNLTSITIPDNVISIGTYAFNACPSLKEVTIGKKVRVIGRNAFFGNTALEEVILPDSLVTIQRNVFESCTNLKKVVIPKSVTTIQANVFKDCDQLTLYVYPDSKGHQYAIDNSIRYVLFVSLDKEEILMPIGKTETVSFTNLPEGASMENAVWTSKDDTIATVSNGMITGVSAGTTVITATSQDGAYIAECQVKVYFEKFIDVPQDKWYHDVVYEANDKGIMTGLKDTTFGPNDPMTRAMVAVVMYRMAGKPEVTYQKYFSDVEKGKWYSNAITWAYENNVIKGYINGKFGVKDNVTREQLAIILNRYVKSLGLVYTADYDLSEFTDANKIASYGVEPLKWTAANGIMSGSKGMMDPKGYATRAMCAKMFLKTLQYIRNGGPVSDSQTGKTSLAVTEEKPMVLAQKAMKLTNQKLRLDLDTKTESGTSLIEGAKKRNIN